MSKLIWNLVKVAYATILRELVLNAIDNPDSEIDDIAMKILDRLFDYNARR